MLEIKPIFDRQVLAKYCHKCDCPLSDALYVYQATNEDELLAGGLFAMRSDHVEAVFYEAMGENRVDFFLFDGILRAGLNYAAEQGVETGCIPEAFRQANAVSFAQLNYPPEVEMNIVNFFQKYKNCTI